MAKGKPRWKDLTFEERLVKQVKRMGASENTIKHLQDLKRNYNRRNLSCQKRRCIDGKG